MNPKRFTSAVAAASILTLGGLGVTIQNSRLQPMSAVAQATTCYPAVIGASFRGNAAPAGVNIRSAPSVNAPLVRKSGANETLYFDGWTHSNSVVNDLWINQPDARWYKLQGQNAWVASAVVYGNAPGSTALPSSPCGSSGGGGQVDMQGLQRLLFGNVASTVTSSYGYQRCDIWGNIYANCQHPALDIAGPVNTPIYSPIDGIVIRRTDNIGAIGIYNQKSNTTFFFGHMNRSDVSLNQNVRKGQQIGIEGTKGNVTGPHLHFEARPGNQPYMATAINQTVNPLDAVNKANR